MRLFTIILSLVSAVANATSVGYIDSKANKFIVYTKFFFYGPAVSERAATGAVEEISRLWNEPKINYYHKGVPYRIEFHFDYAIDDGYAYYQHWITLYPYAKPIPYSHQASTSKFIKRFEPLHFSHHYPITFHEDSNPDALKNDPSLNVIEMVHATATQKVSEMICGGQHGTFVVENASKNGTTFAHEFGHSLGLKHLFQPVDCRNETPSVMCPRGSYTLPKYQYSPEQKAGDAGGTINPIYRQVRAQDVLNLKMPTIVPNSVGIKIIGPHLKAECDASLKSDQSEQDAAYEAVLKIISSK